MYSRRQTLFAGAGLATGLALRGRRAVAKSGAQTLRMGTILPVDSQLGAGVAAFGDEVARRTEGRIRIQPFPDSQLGGEVEMLKGLQLGTIDLAFITGAPLPNIVPEIGVLSIPFLFNGAQHARAVLDGPIGDRYKTLLGAKDLVPLAWGENGMRHLTNSKHPVAAPEDLAGLKLRLPQSEVMLSGFRTLGVDAKPLPFPQLFEALKSGQFDGQENPIATIQSAKFDQVQKHLTLSAHVYDPAVIVMSPDAHEDLSPEDRAAFAEAARIGAAASRAYATRAEQSGVAALQATGMQVVSGIDRVRFAAALAPATAGYEKTFGADRIAQIRQAA